jgi:hypothetical protein
VGSLGYSLMLEGQEGVTWPQWLAIARHVRAARVRRLLTSDHYLSVVTREEPGSNDAWTLLGRSRRAPNASGSARWCRP